ncbi:MAG: hypothetical protein HOL45_06095, partial [Chloroflexi bacterium]|nr:hypothetical protein [Chloroflexota bacterium]
MSSNFQPRPDQQLLASEHSFDRQWPVLLDALTVPVVTVKRHNLLLIRFESNFDLIVYSVVIYFSEEAKRDLNTLFSNALRTGGIFFFSGTETLLDAFAVGFERRAT